MKKVQLLKRRDFGTVLNDSFAFLSENLVRYSKAFLYFVMPLLLIMMVAMTILFNQVGAVLKDFTQMRDFSIHTMSSFLTVYVGIILIISILYMVLNLLAYEYIMLYEVKDDPSEITLEELWTNMKGHAMLMIGSYLGLFGVIILFMTVNVGIVALVMTMSTVLGGFLIFGLIFLWIYLFLPTVNFYLIRLHEGLGIIDSLTRCYTLVRNNWWRTFGVIMVMSFAASALRMMVMAPLTAPDIVTTFQRLKDHPGDTSGLYTPMSGITQALSMAVGIFFSSIICVATAVNYYSLVESNDNTSLQQEIERIGEKPDPEYMQEGEF